MNWRIFIVAVWYGLAETAYFGWNAFPHSDAEAVCDGIAMLMLALALQQRVTVTVDGNKVVAP